MIHVTVWNEYQHEKCEEDIAKIYPEGIHGAIAAFLGKEEDMEVRTATLDMPEHGLTDEVLDWTDVLLWWGHMAHEKVSEEVAMKVRDHILRGMGFLALHSAHNSKPFRYTLGTSGALSWSGVDRERVWVCTPSHPIAQGIPTSFELEREEMYGEPFGIPTPDDNVFISWYRGGEVLRSGCTFRRGAGKIFYFSPGHESFPTYYNPIIQKILINAIRWAKPVVKEPPFSCPQIKTAPEASRPDFHL